VSTAYPHWFGMQLTEAKWYPFIAKCGELGVPLQIQVGRCLRYTDEQPLVSMGQPQTLDVVAADFPEVVLVGIHTGWPWTEEMIAVADKNPNVYIGIDAYAPRYLPDSLVHYMRTWGRGKVLFGTDWPVIDMKRAVDESLELGLDDEALALLFSGTAESIYGVSQ
jgi:predicted TIM-barrel fold metal-dependent hydrolase